MGKGKIGGKYASTKRYPMPTNAGNRTEGMGGGKGEALGFKGSGLKAYSYTRYVNGYPVTITVMASSAKDADRQAKTRGYTSNNRARKYKKKDK